MNEKEKEILKSNKDVSLEIDTGFRLKFETKQISMTGSVVGSSFAASQECDTSNERMHSLYSACRREILLQE